MTDERAGVLERVMVGDLEAAGALGMAQATGARIGRQLARDLGVAGARERQADLHAVGAALTRLQGAANQHAYDQARQAIAAVARRLHAARRWALDVAQLDRVAEAALLMHLQPNCNACNGRGYQLVAGTPHLGDACPHCSGTGKRPYPRRHRAETQQLLAVLGHIQGLLERAVAKRMR